jgi:3-deoxy-manno-octulosonate cytidylyltransferase (CMP-KDO synthetase)
MGSNEMKAIAVIPARLGASRFPGKPLATILGVPMVGHCYFRSRMCDHLNDVYVATCDKEIADYIMSIGGKVVMTAATHTRASERTAEAVQKLEALGVVADVVVMVQGDEPIIAPAVIDETLQHFDDPKVDIVNIMSRIRTKEEFLDHNNVKVVVNQSMDALYFSREPIPSPWKGIEHIPMYNQVGVIAFRREVLTRFNQMPETVLEKIESVDMNRILETGGKIRMVLTETRTIGVDTPAELKAVEELMKSDPFIAHYPKK